MLAVSRVCMRRISTHHNTASYTGASWKCVCACARVCVRMCVSQLAVLCLTALCVRVRVCVCHAGTLIQGGVVLHVHGVEWFHSSDALLVSHPDKLGRPHKARSERARLLTVTHRAHKHTRTHTHTHTHTHTNACRTSHNRDMRMRTVCMPGKKERGS